MDYSNYALSIRPSSSYNVFICDKIFPFSQELFSTNTGIPFNKRRSKLLTSFSLDLHNLARLTSSVLNENSRSLIEYDTFSEYFYPLYVSKFNDDSGDVYNQLKNFYPLNVDNHLLYSGQKYSAEFDFSPLISISGTSQQIEAEKVIYKASIFPIYPFILFSTIQSHESYGPSFLSTLNFNMSSMDNLPIVNISCSTIGGKIMEVIKPASDIYPETDLFEPLLLNPVGAGTAVTESYTNFKNLYRAASMLDCFVDVNTAHTSKEALLKAIQSRNNPDYLLTERIVSYSLSISNNFEMKYTQPSIDGQILDDNIGAKFITLTSRTVSGSFTIYSVEPNIITPSYENGITLYFGGPFFYSIPRVNWNMPKVTINPAGGFTHVITFTAKLPEKTGLFVSNLPVSEFGITFDQALNL